MLAIIDYGVGNLFSLASSLRAVGVESVVTSDKETINTADRIILPGVGAFGDAAKKLCETGMHDAVLRYAEQGRPIMGICLGMQLLFEKSYEYGEHAGLGLISGEVIPMAGTIEKGLMIPHIGWNGLTVKKSSPILKYVKNGDCVYFVHSFYVDGNNSAASSVTEYGASITATVQCGNVFGCQFHPEKSGNVGLSILRAFSEI